MDTSILVLICVLSGCGLVGLGFLAWWLLKRNKKKSRAELYSNLLGDISIEAPQVPKETVVHSIDDQANSNMMCALYYLRTSNQKLKSTLSNIGTRSQKFFYSLEAKDVCLYVVSYTNTSIQKFANEYRSIISSFSVYPFISVPIGAEIIPSRECAVATRPFSKNGSIRDYIFSDNPTKPISQKGKLKKDSFLSDELICKFGREILEAMFVFRLNGFPCYHLHTGNVLVVDNSIIVSEFENSLLGLTPKYKKLFTLRQKVSPDIISFGVIVFEMAFGYEPDSIETINFQLNTVRKTTFKELLELIFVDKDCESATLENIMRMKMFANVRLKAQINTKPNAYSASESEFISYANDQMQLSLFGKSAPLLANSKTTTTKKKKRRQIQSRDFTSTNRSSSSALLQNQPQPASKALLQTKPEQRKSSAQQISKPMNSMPPPAAPAAPPPPPPQMTLSSVPAISSDRANLLSSITAFNKSKLKKVD